MKLVLVQLVSIVAAAAASLLIGSRPAASWWGAAGIATRGPATVICMSGALVAMVPLAWAALARPEQVGMAALAGTAVRLLVTIPAAFAYQMSGVVHAPSFTYWLLVLYLPLMAVETAIAVALIQRTFGNGGGSRAGGMHEREAPGDRDDDPRARTTGGRTVRWPCLAG